MRVHFECEQDCARGVAQGCPRLDRSVAVDRDVDLVELAACRCWPFGCTPSSMIDSVIMEAHVSMDKATVCFVLKRYSAIDLKRKHGGF